MDDSIRVASAGPADDIIARIMSEIEDVIGLIQSPTIGERVKRAASRLTDEVSPAAHQVDNA